MRTVALGLNAEIARVDLSLTQIRCICQNENLYFSKEVAAKEIYESHM